MPPKRKKAPYRSNELAYLSRQALCAAMKSMSYGELDALLRKKDREWPYNQESINKWGITEARPKALPIKVIKTLAAALDVHHWRQLVMQDELKESSGVSIEGAWMGYYTQSLDLGGQEAPVRTSLHLRFMQSRNKDRPAIWAYASVNVDPIGRFRDCFTDCRLVGNAMVLQSWIEEKPKRELLVEPEPWPAPTGISQWLLRYDKDNEQLSGRVLYIPDVGSGVASTKIVLVRVGSVRWREKLRLLRREYRDYCKQLQAFRLTNESDGLSSPGGALKHDGLHVAVDATG